jgi:WD40 repeat protein
MAPRFNPPPGWPPPPAGWTPFPGWQPDPSWPPPPDGWQLWIDDAQPVPEWGARPAARKRALQPGSGRIFNAFISYSHAVDNQLAPALQRGLQRFAKPWYQRQALRVFRDEENLSANPGLWSSIQAALDAAEFFILLASPESAKSSWVDREVTYWCAHKPEHNLLIAVTGGTLVWDEEARDFDWELTTALPPSLRGRFSEEPRYIDLRWARTERQVSLRHPLFRDRVADLAATLHHQSKDDLVGEEIRQHRRTVRLARSITALLTILTILAGGLAIQATNAGNQAKKAANEERRQRGRAETQLRLATARYMAGRAVSKAEDDYTESLMLSLASLAIADSTEGRSSLLTNLQRDPKLRLAEKHRAYGRGLTAMALSPDSRTLALASGATVLLWNVSGRGRAAGQLPRSYGSVTCLAFSTNGKTLAVGSDRGIVLWDVKARRPIGSPFRYHSGRVRAIAISSDARTVASSDDGGQLIVWDAKSGEERAQFHPLDTDRNVNDVNRVAFSPDGRKLAAIIHDHFYLWDNVSDGQLGESLVPFLSAFFDTLFDIAFSPDGQTLAFAGKEYAELYDVSTHFSGPTGILKSPGGHVVKIGFTPDGKTVVGARRDGSLLLWDAVGTQVGVLKTSEKHPADMWAISSGGRVGAAGTSDGSVVVWDLDRNSWQDRACSIVRRRFTTWRWTTWTGYGIPEIPICSEYP